MTAASTLMHRLRAENGSAIVVAMGAMSVILLLSAWTAGASTQLSGSSERDRSAKRALPATEGAIRQANYKLNNLKPGPTECPDGFTADGAWCRGSADPAIGLNAGNGVVFDYWLTKANPGGTCAGFPVRANLQARGALRDRAGHGEWRRSPRPSAAGASHGTEAGCTGGGSIIGNNAVTFVNPGAADHLQIFLNGAGPVEFNNEFTMNGYLHAPNAAVRFKNANGGVANITGGIAARTIDAKNSLNFTTPICVIDGVSQDCPPPVGETESIFYRTAWIECSPTRAVAPDPTSGC